MRDYFTNAIIYHEHLCHRGDEEGELFEGTSKAAEGYATDIIAKRAKHEEMDIAVHALAGQ